MEEVNWSNKEEVKKILSSSGYSIRYAPEEIKADPEMVLIAATQNEFALDFVSEDFRKDSEFMLKLVAKNGNALSKFEPKENISKEMAVVAVNSSTLAMNVLPMELRKDPEIVMIGLDKTIKGLKYKFDNIPFYQKDPLGHIKVDINNILANVPELREDDNYKGIITEKYMDLIKEYAPNALKDSNFLLYAIEHFGSSAIEYAAEALFQNKNFILEAIKKNFNVKSTNRVQDLLLKTPGIANRAELDGLKDEKMVLDEEIKEIKEKEQGLNQEIGQ